MGEDINTLDDVANLLVAKTVAEGEHAAFSLRQKLAEFLAASHDLRIAERELGGTRSVEYAHAGWLASGTRLIEAANGSGHDDG